MINFLFLLALTCNFNIDIPLDKQIFFSSWEDFNKKNKIRILVLEGPLEKILKIKNKVNGLNCKPKIIFDEIDQSGGLALITDLKTKVSFDKQLKILQIVRGKTPLFVTNTIFRKPKSPKLAMLKPSKFIENNNSPVFLTKINIKTNLKNTKESQNNLIFNFENIAAETNKKNIKVFKKPNLKKIIKNNKKHKFKLRNKANPVFVKKRPLKSKLSVIYPKKIFENKISIHNQTNSKPRIKEINKSKVSDTSNRDNNFKIPYFLPETKKLNGNSIGKNTFGFNLNPKVKNSKIGITHYYIKPKLKNLKIAILDKKDDFQDMDNNIKNNPENISMKSSKNINNVLKKSQFTFKNTQINNENKIGFNKNKYFKINNENNLKLLNRIHKHETKVFNNYPINIGFNEIPFPKIKRLLKKKFEKSSLKLSFLTDKQGKSTPYIKAFKTRVTWKGPYNGELVELNFFPLEHKSKIILQTKYSTISRIRTLSGRRVEVLFEACNIKRSFLKLPLDTSFFKGPMAYVLAQEINGNTKVIITLKEESGFRIEHGKNNLALIFGGY